MSVRDRLDIRCPQCTGCALFVEPFGFHTAAPAGQPSLRWGGWHVVERYPSVLPWRAPAGSPQQYLTTGGSDGQGYRLLHRGVVECGCGRPPWVHTLAWPDDAWWQWSIRGRLLWAWDRGHAERILAYVGATDRPPRPTSGELGGLPSHFLAAKLRPTVVRAIQRSLAESASSPRIVVPATR